MEKQCPGFKKVFLDGVGTWSLFFFLFFFALFFALMIILKQIQNLAPTHIKKNMCVHGKVYYHYLNYHYDNDDYGMYHTAMIIIIIIIDNNRCHRRLDLPVEQNTYIFF